MSVEEKLDKGLSKYYNQLGRKDYYDRNSGKGKFKKFIEDNDIDEDTLKDDLNDEAEESTLLDFDSDGFPLNPPIEDETEKNKEIHRILKCMVESGKYEPKQRKMTLEINICKDIDGDTLKRSSIQYQKQMSSITLDTAKNEDLMYYLGVGMKQRYPFLTYMVDSYTNDKAIHYQQKGVSISLYDWTAKCKFMQNLKKNNEKEAIKLHQAMESFMKRTMSRLKFTTTFVIDDELESITEYIVSTPSFIAKLIDQLKSVPPFHIDLLIAVNKVKSTVSDENKTDDDDKENYPVDHIGNINEKLKGFNVNHCAPSPRTHAIDDEENASVSVITRILIDQYRAFRTVLSTSKSSKWDGETYPTKRRFSILIDRREGTKKGKDRDDVAFFEPPDDCNEMPHDHVPEIGFEFARKCLIPSGDKEDYITALDGICGELLSFIFHVEQRDDIRCYLIWNGQTMRFQGEHITQILPILFANTERNKKFKQEQIKTKSMKRMFDDAAHDETFNAFYREVTIC